VSVGSDRPVKVTVDKMGLGHLGSDQTVEIERGIHDAQFVRLRRRPFTGLLTEKFGLT
jgi:NAD kinase